MKLIKYTLFLVVILTLTGCATSQSTFFDTREKLDFNQKSYFIMEVEIYNAVKPAYNPNTPITLSIVKKGAKDGEPKSYFSVLNPSEFQGTKGGAASGFFKGVLPPGDYTMSFLAGQARAFPVTGTYMLPLSGDFQLEKNEVAYLGKLRARTRKKRKGEYGAGSVLPLIDQAATGFGSSTFDVHISNDVESAKDWMNKEHPALAAEELSIKILPKYERIWDSSDVKPMAAPVFTDETVAIKDIEKEVGSIESEYPDIVVGLNSPVSTDFQRAAAKVSQKKLYTDKGVLNMMIARLEQVVENPELVSDRYLIDSFAHCVINIGRSDDVRSEPLLKKVTESKLPRKVRKHAEQALKRKQKKKGK
ncbi:MAG: hypothetical protein ACRBEE_08805 [Arenicella sp.]